MFAPHPQIQRVQPEPARGWGMDQTMTAFFSDSSMSKNLADDVHRHTLAQHLGFSGVAKG
jgi:hypothetical protein